MTLRDKGLYPDGSRVHVRYSRKRFDNQLPDFKLDFRCVFHIRFFYFVSLSNIPVYGEIFILVPVKGVFVYSHERGKESNNFFAKF